MQFGYICRKYSQINHCPKQNPLKLLFVPVAASVKAVRAYHVLRQSDGGYEVVQRVEFQGGDIDLIAYVLHHCGIFRSVVPHVFPQILVVRTLVPENEAARDELKWCP